MAQVVEFQGNRIEFPDDMQPAQIEAVLKRNALSITPQQVEPAPNPTSGMGPLDTTLAGVGKGMASGMRALGMGGLAGRMGLPATKEEADRLDAPLEQTTGGKIGSAVGLGALAAPLALIPGANTYAGAALLGGLGGGALTEGGIGDRATGAALGAAGGLAGKGAGDLLAAGASRLMSGRAAERATQQAANTQRDAAAAAAQQAGYVLPPADVKSSAINEALNGLSGKIKTAQVASARNQGVTDELARKAIGLKAGDVLDDAAYKAIRDNASQVGYTPVRQSGLVTSDKAFNTALDNITSSSQGAAKSFPGLKNNTLSELENTIAALKQPNFDAGDAIDATRVLRDMADDFYRKGDKTLGKAYKSASNAIEEQLERHLQAQGMPDALKSFRDARQLIAKTYSVQGATNSQTGNVSAQALAKKLEKGAPLSGELRTIAETSSAFPKATQTLKEAPKAMSPLDFAVGAMSGASTGNPLTMGVMAARPAVRSLLLSGGYQNRMMTPNYAGGLLDSTVLPALSSDALRRGLIPGGMGGLLSLPTNQQ